MNWFRFTLIAVGLAAVALPAVLTLPCVLRDECGLLSAYAAGSPIRLIALLGAAMIAVPLVDLALTTLDRDR